MESVDSISVAGGYRLQLSVPLEHYSLETPFESCQLSAESETSFKMRPDAYTRRVSSAVRCAEQRVLALTLDYSCTTVQL